MTRANAGRLGVKMVALCGVFTLGCGGEAGIDAAPIESVEQQGNAIQESVLDRPAAASIMVLGQGLWVFACGNDHQLYRGWRTGSTWNWEWVFDGCASVPTAGPWRSGLITTIAVYVRGTDQKLWEINLLDDGTVTQVFDVSTDSGFGSIAGAPVVVAAGVERIGVAVKKAANNRLYTLDYINGWQAHPVLNSVGGFVSTPATIVASHRPETSGMFLSVQINNTSHMIFARSDYTQSFRPYVSPIQYPDGVVGLGALDTSTCGDICAYAGYGGQLKYTTSSLKWRWRDHYYETYLGGSPWSGTVPRDMIAARATDGSLTYFWSHTGMTETPPLGVWSAPAFPFNEGWDVVFAGATNRLYAYSLFGPLGRENMGFTVLPF